MGTKIIPLMLSSLFLFCGGIGTGAGLQAGIIPVIIVFTMVSLFALMAVYDCGRSLLKVVPDGYTPAYNIPSDAIDRKWLDEIGSLAAGIQTPPEWCTTPIERQQHTSRIAAQHRALIDMINAASRNAGQRVQ